ncbi:MAG: hypothetical protein ACR2ML_07340, partial [Solirubrobacteraceae bacterium]
FVGSSAARDAPDARDDSRGQLLFIDDNATGILVTAVAGALGALAVGAALLFMFRATKARRPELPNAARVCTIVGPVLLVLAGVAGQGYLVVKASGFATTGSTTLEEAKDVFRSGPVQFAGFGTIAGQLAIGFAFVLIALNAMRTGLLTRFMGVLGIIAGVLFVIPLGSPLPIVQSFWFGALALLFSGRWPQGMPPAWASGAAVPWPSQQEIRELRERESERSEPASESESGRDPDPEPAAVTAGGPAHAASKKRKRKRRR